MKARDGVALGGLVIAAFFVGKLAGRSGSGGENLAIGPSAEPPAIESIGPRAQPAAEVEQDTAPPALAPDTRQPTVPAEPPAPSRINVHEAQPRLRPDVLLGPVVLVLIGIVVDRLRESYASETVTAWILPLVGTLAFFLARLAGFRRAASFYYLALVVMIYGVLKLYDYSPVDRLPDVWWWSTLTVSLLWAAGLSVERVWRAEVPFSRSRVWEASIYRLWILVDVWILGWVPFSLVFTRVASKFLYFTEVPFKRPELFSSALNWLMVILAWTSCLLLIFVGTVPISWRRGRLACLGVGVYALMRAIGTGAPALHYVIAALLILVSFVPNDWVNFINRKTVGAWPKID